MSAPLALLLIAPALAQMLWRLWHALETTSPLLGVSPSRTDLLTAGDGIAGGAITLAIGLVAIGLLRQRFRYVAGALFTLALFGVFPIVAYGAGGGIARTELPTLTGMLTPPTWPHHGWLQLAFVATVAVLAGAAVDLLVRIGLTVRRALSR